MSTLMPPKTDRPRTVAMLGWASLHRQAEEGSGYNLNASELAIGLTSLGHNVRYLGSGLCYSIRPGPFVRETRAWKGVRCFELVNSPNLAPSAFNIRNVNTERRCEKTTRLVLQWLRAVGADIVHAHSLEGLSLDLIPAIESAGIQVICTTHNYWFACPQVDLLHNEHEVCTDYDGGRRCESCLEAPNPKALRFKRGVRHTVKSLTGPMISAQVRTTGSAIARVLRRELVVEPPPIDELRFLGYDNGAVEAARAAEGETSTYGVRAVPGELPKAPPVLPSDTNKRVLAARDVHLKVLNDFGKRRQDGIAALNAATLVTPPSDFLGRVHESMGLAPAKRRTVRLGQPHFDRMHRAAIELPGYDHTPWTPDTPSPLRLAFFGTVRPNKGLRVLADAIVRLPDDIRRRCQFHIRAAGGDWGFRKMLSGFPQVQFAGAYDLIQRAASVPEYDIGILPHIWMENSPLVLLEHLHAGKMVITSNLGGPPEWIVERDGTRNGLLFPSGDPNELAECINTIVRGDVKIPSPRTIHEVPPSLTSYPAHIKEVVGIYEEAIIGNAAGSRAVDEALQPA